MMCLCASMPCWCAGTFHRKTSGCRLLPHSHRGANWEPPSVAQCTPACLASAVLITMLSRAAMSSSNAMFSHPPGLREHGFGPGFSQPAGHGVPGARAPAEHGCAGWLAEGRAGCVHVAVQFRSVNCGQGHVCPSLAATAAGTGWGRPPGLSWHKGLSCPAPPTGACCSVEHRRPLLVVRPGFWVLQCTKTCTAAIGTGLTAALSRPPGSRERSSRKSFCSCRGIVCTAVRRRIWHDCAWWLTGAMLAVRTWRMWLKSCNCQRVSHSSSLVATARDEGGRLASVARRGCQFRALSVDHTG